MASTWEAIGLLVGTGMLFASDWRPPKTKKEAEKAGYTTQVSQCTPAQAAVLVAYFFAASRVNGGPPSFLGGLGYCLFGFLVVCFLAGADAGNMSKDFPFKFRLCVSLSLPPT